MSIKLRGNGMWESSRMMLPQHKEEINRSLRQIGKQNKPTIHEDELQIIVENIGLSYANQEIIRVSVFGEYGNRDVIGIVTNVNQYGRKFRVEFEEGYEWIEFDEIVTIALE